MYQILPRTPATCSHFQSNAPLICPAPKHRHRITDTIGGLLIGWRYGDRDRVKQLSLRVPRPPTVSKLLYNALIALFCSLRIKTQVARCHSRPYCLVGSADGDQGLVLEEAYRQEISTKYFPSGSKIHTLISSHQRPQCLWPWQIP